MNKVRKKKLIGLCVIWVIAIVLFMVYRNYGNDIDRSTFTKNASVALKEDKVGAMISLKEAIHGTNGITYRYKIKTDCDKWDFETTYMTGVPLNWVDNKTSAVEVLTYDTQIRYDNTVYASGTYYSIPLLDNITSEDMTFEEWQENIMKQAYQTYVSEPQKSLYTHVLGWFILLLPLCVVAWLIITTALDALDRLYKERTVSNQTESESQSDSLQSYEELIQGEITKVRKELDEESSDD